jgi:hypothetical protein
MLFNSFEVNYHYLNRYLKFIINCKSDLNDYSENHHILPISIFSEFRLEPKNLVKLTARQHFIAHWILSKVFTKNRQRFLMLKAFGSMSRVGECNSGRLNVSSKLFEQARIANSAAMRLTNPMHDPSTVAKMKESFKIYRQSPKGVELRKKQSESRKGVNNISPEGIKRLSDLYSGVPRPQTKEHTQLIRQITSLGEFITPFGIFDSPNQASMSELNKDKLSRYQINKRCKDGSNGFSFKSNGRVNKRGLHKRKNQNL